MSEAMDTRNSDGAGPVIRALRNGDLAKLAQPGLDDPCERSDEMYLLAVRVTGTTDYPFAERSTPRTGLRPDSPLDEPYPIAWGVSGTAILADLSKAEPDRAVTRAAVYPTNGVPRDRDELEVMRERERVRRQGHSVRHGTRVTGAIGIAAPVRAGHRRVIGNLCVAIPEERFFALQKRLNGILTARYADQLSRHLSSERSTPPDVILQGVV